VTSIFNEFSNNPIATLAAAATLIVIIVSWFSKFLKKGKGYLIYKTRIYKLSKEEEIEVICIWNPTLKDLNKKEITKDFELVKVSTLSLLGKNSNESECLFLDSDNKMHLSFNTFASRSGCVYVIKHRGGIIRSFLESGEINNKQIRSYKVAILEKISTASCFVICGCFASPLVFYIFDASIEFSSSSMLLIVAFIAIYCYIDVLRLKMLKPLTNYFDCTS
jgi:hypothetical protein